MVDNSVERKKYMQARDFLKSNYMYVLQNMTLGVTTSITDSLPINYQISKKGTQTDGFVL